MRASYPGQSPASSAVLGLLASSGSSPLPPGMMLGGGCGRELAHWIIHGRPEKDMYGYDIRCVTPPAPGPRGLRAPSSIGGPWGRVSRQGWVLALGMGIRQRLCHSPCPSEELESIRLNSFNEFTRGVYLICLIPLLRKQLPSDRRRLR